MKLCRIQALCLYAHLAVLSVNCSQMFEFGQSAEYYQLPIVIFILIVCQTICCLVPPLGSLLHEYVA